MDADSLAARARSFDGVAAEYERSRPGYPEAAVEWIVPAGARDALDLGAGTGKLTEPLLARGLRVAAVEPLAAMRAVIEDRLPAATALAGSAEEIPLPDASVDLVTVAQAWHWLDAERASAEIARVLRPGGRLALVWNRRDERVGWVAALSEAMESGENEMIRMEEVAIGPPFGPLETLEREWGFELDLERLLELVRSRSYVITAPPGKRAEILDRVRDLVATDPALAGRERFELPYRTFAFRAHLPG